MDCDRFNLLIYDYIEGELNDRKTDTFEKHLSSCEECQQDYEDSKYLYKLFSVLAEGSGMPQKDKDSLLARVKKRLKEHFM